MEGRTQYNQQPQEDASMKDRYYVTEGIHYAFGFIPVKLHVVRCGDGIWNVWTGSKEACTRAARRLNKAYAEGVFVGKNSAGISEKIL